MYLGGFGKRYVECATNVSGLVRLVDSMISVVAFGDRQLGFVSFPPPTLPGRKQSLIRSNVYCLIFGAMCDYESVEAGVHDCQMHKLGALRPLGVLQQCVYLQINIQNTCCSNPAFFIVERSSLFILSCSTDYRLRAFCTAPKGVLPTTQKKGNIASKRKI